MQRDLRGPLLVLLLLAVLWCAWLVLKPFLPGLIWAAVLVTTFKPAHRRLTARLRGRRWAASAIVTLAVAAFVVVPTVLAGIQAVKVSVQVYNWVQDTYAEGKTDIGANEKLQKLDEKVSQTADLFGYTDFELKTAQQEVVKKIGAFVAAKTPGVVGGLLYLTFSFVIMLGMMFPFFANGDALVAWIAGILPVPREAADRIMGDLGLMTRTVFISAGLTAAVQATLCAIAYLALQVPNALPLGAATLFVAILPAGPGLVWAPVAIWLAATGHPFKALILTVWGAGVVGTIDNVLRPYLAKGGANLSTTLLFLGLLGGLIAFGLIGLFVGPIVLYLLVELMDAIRREAV